MFRLFDNAQFDILKNWRKAATIAVAFTVPGLILFALIGLDLSIEFTGGTFVQVVADTNANIDVADIRGALGREVFGSSEVSS